MQNLLYTNNLKNWGFGKESPQNFCSERATIAGRLRILKKTVRGTVFSEKQVNEVNRPEGGASENRNFEAKPTPPKTNSSGWLCICLIVFCFGLLIPSIEARNRSPQVASLITPPGSITVVIDAGHGGTDRGTRSKTPFCEEKRLCLQTARLVRKYLDQLGYHVVMTRNSDAFIPLPRRVEIAAQAGSSIFVSIHYNSARSPLASGVEVFFFDSKEVPSRASLSKKLANGVLSSIIRRTGFASRGVKKGNYYVLRETSMPAIIIEGGFMSNPQECALLKDVEYQEKIAKGIAEGIDRYFKRYEKRSLGGG